MLIDLYYILLDRTQGEFMGKKIPKYLVMMCPHFWLQHSDDYTDGLFISALKFIQENNIRAALTHYNFYAGETVFDNLVPINELLKFDSYYSISESTIGFYTQKDFNYFMLIHPNFINYEENWDFR
jgi:hypothetical protein